MLSPDCTTDLSAYLAMGTPVPLSTSPAISTLSRQRRSSLIHEFEEITGIDVPRSSQGILWTDRLLELLETARTSDLPLAQALPLILSDRNLTCPGPPPSTRELAAHCQRLDVQLSALDARITALTNVAAPEQTAWTDAEISDYLRTLPAHQELAEQLGNLKADVQDLTAEWTAYTQEPTPPPPADPDSDDESLTTRLNRWWQGLMTTAGSWTRR